MEKQTPIKALARLHGLLMLVAAAASPYWQPATQFLACSVVFWLVVFPLYWLVGAPGWDDF